MLLLAIAGFFVTANGQSLPGDSIVFGPMYSPVYNDSVRVWILTKDNTGSGDVLSLEVLGSLGSVLLTGTEYQSDDRLGYHLRSYVYSNLHTGETYTAIIRKNGIPTVRKAIIKNAVNEVVDFEFLAGGCGRIYDTTRCIDRPESQTHVNGDPAIYNKMAGEGSDMMIWLGDATYLLGLQHANGQCPNGVDDWANKDMAFARYMFYRKFHDSLTRAMPQLAITDNHDLGPNEYDKTMPTLAETKDIFMDWWPNPHYNSTTEGQGLFSSYKYKDVEYFLLDNRSYRDGIQQHLGPEQLAWLKQSLLHSTATFKVLISGTPAFAKHWGGRNFSVTAQGDELVKYIKDNKIDGVLCFSADIHEQELYGRYGDVNYPLYDILSGNLNSDVGTGQYTIDYTSESILRGIKQTYLRVSVYGQEGNRRMKIAYVGLNGQPYFESVIHADMLRSVDDSTINLSLSFDGSVTDSSVYGHVFQSSGITYEPDRKNKLQSAIRFSPGSEVRVFDSKKLELTDRAFTFTCWVNPSQLPDTSAAIYSNASITLGIDKDGYPQYIDHVANKTYTGTSKIFINKWTHLAWKFDNVKHQLFIYYNGIQIQRWTNVMPPAPNNAVPILLGNNYQNKHFIGSIDEVKLYGKLISDIRIQEVAEYTTHRGDVLQLSSASRMFVPSTLVNAALSKDFTIEFWGKLNADPGTNFKILASNARVNNNTTGLSFEFPDNNKLNVVAGTNGSSWNSISDKGDVWNIGEWNHVAVTAIQNGSLIYYVNGEKVGETAFASYVPNTTGLGLGYSPAYVSNVAAEMDELRIWKVALPQDSIRKHMHYPVAVPANGLELYYDFGTHTDTSILSTGTQPSEIKLNGGTLIAATSPVTDVAPLYQDTVRGNWSRGNKMNAGLSFPDKITSYTNNIIVGKDVDNSFGVKGDIYYLKGGWEIDPLNISFANIKINLAQALPKADSIVKKAGLYYLLSTDSLVIISQGVSDGTNITFANVFLEKGIYRLGWKADTAGVIGATFQVSAGSDDAEQDITAGTMYLTSSDLEFTKDGASDQLLAVRFAGVTIPQGAVINSAYLQFTVDEVNTTGDVNVLLGVENVDNPLTMSTFDYDIYHRIMYYGDTVIWKPAAFTTVGEAGVNQRTPDISGLLQTIVDRPNWTPGNAVLFSMIDPAAARIPGYTANTAKRVAQAYENNPSNAARLVVNYIIPHKYYNGKFPVPAKTSWKYHDKGIDLKDSSWTAINYNDSAWAFGDGIFGYGDGNESTTLNYGTDAAHKRTTYYLRHIFKVDDRTQYDSLLFDVLRDDGAIVYVNGTEAFRMNMPSGSIGYNTYASSTVNDGDETKYFRTKTANLLKNGINVIAVELHQSSASSSDLSFDMSVGYELPPLGPAVYPLAKGSAWNYLDTGVSLDAEAWKDTTYNDTSWPEGKGPLGYGDPMTTTISYGPDNANKIITDYFRRAIIIDTSSIADFVEIGLRRDDGAVVYINGNEVIRDNMPAGTIDYKTISVNTIDGAAETTYYTFRLPKSVFISGKNQIAVEVHNRNGQSSDLGFDLYMKDGPTLNPPADCNGRHISCFTSIVPTAPTDKLVIADEHRFQMIFKQGQNYTIGGAVPGNADYTAYLPINGSSTRGHLSVNHENTPGGVSMLDLHYNDSLRLWMVDTSQPVDLYNNNLITTTRNCSGGITPWGTVITCEESLNSGDVNGDGYEDVGWAVEIDPVTSKVIDHDGDGKQDKLWALGRVNHENVVVSSDRKTVYYGEDGGTHCMYKFVADVPGNLSAGTVYVLSLDQALVNDEPTVSTAKWIQVPNTTQHDRNSMSAIAASLGGTNFNGIEDCDISPIDHKIYIASKGKGRVYRFDDKGDVATNFETFVGGMSYNIYTKQGVYTEAWGGGNDNLAFDDKGNMWVCQDGDNNYIWVVRPDHSQSAPKVELFGSSPAGGEPTGLTFSPDYRFGFISIQHPNGSNAAQADATTNNVKFDNSATIVFALHENLGNQPPVAGFKADTTVVVAGGTVVFTDTSHYYPTTRKWLFEGGSPATSASATETVIYDSIGFYTTTLQVANTAGADTAVYPKYIEVIAPPPVVDFTASTMEVFKGNEITFTDLSTNKPASRNWTFTGGTPAVAVDSMPVVTYNTPGIYDVTLQAGNRAGFNTATKSRYILVKDSVEIPNKNVWIFPNPTDGRITIEFKLPAGENVSLELFNMAGSKLVQIGSLKTTGSLQKLHFNVAPYVKNSQVLVIVIRTAHTKTRRLLFYSK
ncbi:Secreted phosphatase, PhoX family [Chitinophaga sp. CF118]|nr:Secreted phosphatase, PhoX family [Chitinophaga sp. CF118]